MTADERAKLIREAMQIVWISLDSHLEYTYKKHPDGKVFHKKTIKEYCRLLEILSHLY